MLARTTRAGEQEWVVMREQRWFAMSGGRVTATGGEDDWQVCVRVMVYRDEELDVEDAADAAQR
jgi:hypothetical protein